MRAEPAAPVLGDPAYINGQKLRVRSITADGTLELRASFAGPGAPRLYRLPHELAWDPIAGLWRDQAAYR